VPAVLWLPKSKSALTSGIPYDKRPVAVPDDKPAVITAYFEPPNPRHNLIEMTVSDSHSVLSLEVVANRELAQLSQAPNEAPLILISIPPVSMMLIGLVDEIVATSYVNTSDVLPTPKPEVIIVFR